MSSKHLLDPELLPLFEIYPEESPAFTNELLPAIRELGASAIVMGDPDQAGLTREEVTVPGVNGPDVRCLVYRPKDQKGKVPGYLHLHGGGYILGSPEMSDIQNIAMASALGIVIVSVDYRLAPETPAPGPAEDAYAGLAWLFNNAEELNVDRDRIAVGGESAGGGLAATLAIMARDRGEFNVCHQHLTYPMIDNLTGSEGHEGDPLTGEFVWTRDRNQFGWSAYLGDGAPVSPHVAARLDNYEGMPSTWLFTAALDLFRDENIAYAQRLLEAGVPTELVIYPGACHAFQLVADSSLAKRFARDHREALARGLDIRL